MNYLFDSDVLIDYFNHQKFAVSLVEDLVDNDSFLAVSVLTITEMISGWDEKSVKRYLPLLYKIFVVEEVTRSIAEKAGEWRYYFKSRGIALHVVDTSIAATAFLNGYILVTNNRKDYPMEEVRLYG